MADVTLTYKGSTVAEMDASGSKTFKTAGKYCEGDIGVSYVKPSGGGTEIPESAFVISGNCNYRFANNGWSWFIDNYGNQITTSNITSASYMFSNYLRETIPFEINIGNMADIDYIFGDSNIKILPYINGKIQNARSLFSGCKYLNNIPENWAEHINWSHFNSYQFVQRSNMFNNCYSIRHIPSSLIAVLWGNSGNTAVIVTHYSQFMFCCSLNEINNVVPHQAILTTNRCNYMFDYCCRLKNITFAKQDDNTPYTVSWKNQVIDLTNFVGYASNKTYILNYNSGITADKEVKDATTYAALKNDNDWFTADAAYSRYNHDSAVATINSLPDASAYLATAGGTNTIKFKGAAGSATDGGAINTLTEEEIAVATAKGWTVSLV